MISDTEYDKHVQESMKLMPEGYRHLYAIRMRPKDQGEILVTLTNENQVEWQGRTWEDFGCHLSGYSQNSTGEVSRPMFSLSNPNAAFSGYAHSGWLDNAEIVRYRVLRSHLLANVNSFVKHTWRVAKISALNSKVVVCELRGAMDGHNFVFPPRAFVPPEFPMVSI